MRGPNPTIEDKRAQVVALDRQIADLKNKKIAAEPSAPEALDKKQLLVELKREVQSILKRREERARVFRELKNGLGETEDEYQRQLEVLERSLVRAEIAGKPWYSSSWLAKKIRRDIIKLKKGYGKE